MVLWMAGMDPAKSCLSLWTIAEVKTRITWCFDWLLCLSNLGGTEKSTLPFLLQDTPRNFCDWLFNILKLKYWQLNVFSTEMLMNLLNECDLVNALLVQVDDFKDYDKFLDQIYKGIETGTVTGSHFFQSTLQQPGMLCVSDTTFHDLLGKEQNLIKNSNKKYKLLNNFLNDLGTIILPRLADIKKVELYSKIWPYIPEEYWPTLCPNPGEEVTQRVNKTCSKQHSMKKKVVEQTNTKRKHKDPPASSVVAATMTSVLHQQDLQDASTSNEYNQNDNNQ